MSITRNILVGIIMFAIPGIAVAQSDYPGQEQYSQWEADQVRKYYHPHEDSEGSRKWRERFYGRQMEMRGRADEWNTHGRYGQSPYERECNRVGCR